MEPVLEPTPETETTDLLSILLVTEDVLLETPTSLNAESMVDQTTMTSALKLMSNAQVYHTQDQHSTELDLNSLLAETHIPVTFGEKPVMENGDHSPHTTSGITTTVLKLCAET
jgi:hypothetical protein